MGLTKFFRQSKSIAKKSAGEKQADKKKEKNVFAAVKNFERDRGEELKKSLKNTRLILCGSMLANVALAVALSALSPLKSVEPFVLRVDTTTGYVDTVRPYNMANETYDETVSRYFLTRFVENRESYEWNTVQSMFDTVELMSSGSVFAEYKNMMYGKFSPVTKLKQNNKILVRVQSVTFLESDLAQVRFIKAISDLDGKPASGYTPTQWIATVKFDYTREIKTEAQRQVNPFGLNVLTYRVDPEVSK